MGYDKCCNCTNGQYSQTLLLHTNLKNKANSCHNPKIRYISNFESICKIPINLHISINLYLEVFWDCTSKKEHNKSNFTFILTPREVLLIIKNILYTVLIQFQCKYGCRSSRLNKNFNLHKKDTCWMNQ